MPKTTPKSGNRLAPEVGKRVATFFRREYPRNTAKELAREYDCAPDTAKKWLSGQCPSTEHLLAMWLRHKARFAAFVFPDIDEQTAGLAKLAENQERLRREHERLLKAYEDAFSED